MNTEQRQIINENSSRFRNIDFNQLIPRLREYKMFNRYMWEDIQSTSDVLRLLPTRGPKALLNFIAVLRECGYDVEADALETQSLPSRLPAPRLPDELFYKMSSTPLGYCFIINNMKFDISSDLKCRVGSDVEAKAFKDFFKNAGFEAKVMDNLTSEKMYEYIEDFAEWDKFNRVDSMILIIMSHGGHINNKEILYGTDGGFVYKDKIYDFFSNRNIGLQCKPKVFFFIASIEGKESLDSEQFVIARKSKVILPEKTDMLIIHILYSYSETIHEKDLYFCHALIRALNKFYKTHDLETIIQLAIQELEGKVSQTKKIINSIHVESTVLLKNVMLCRRN